MLRTVRNLNSHRRKAILSDQKENVILITNWKLKRRGTKHLMVVRGQFNDHFGKMNMNQATMHMCFWKAVLNHAVCSFICRGIKLLDILLL